jgi:hypothetical protein
MSIRRLLPIALAAAAFVPTAAAAHAPYESVTLAPLPGSHVSGRITYHAQGGGTSASVRLTHVPSGATVRVLLHAGSCRRHGASFALVHAGRISFHALPVPIGTVADGRHVFTVVVNGREAACAAIPGMS